MSERPKLAISFSGGRTSALMTSLCYQAMRGTHEIAITFANTGCEHPATLDFVQACADRFGLPVVWLEAIIDPRTGVGPRHRIVTHATASRNGEPFEAYISKHGIPNRMNPQCTSRLKVEVMESYLRDLGFTRGRRLNYDTAIGIRADEVDRVSSRWREKRFIYPLVSAGITKRDVLAFWADQPFDLRLPGEHYGNCVWCWKKSDRKLLTLAADSPEVFAFPRRMEELYLTHRASTGTRPFFRGNRLVRDLERLAAEPFKRFGDVVPVGDPLDEGSGCGESCEIGSDESEGASHE